MATESETWSIQMYFDIDSDDSLSGIAIVSNNASASEGRWQYFDSASNVWINIGTVSTSSAVAISADANIRFLPTAGYSGTPTPVEFIAIDASYGGPFSDTTVVRIDVSTAGETTPYSADSAELDIEVRQFGVSVTPNSATTTESGSTATFEVVLTGQPSGEVSISLSSDDASEGIVSTNQLVFNETNFDIPQFVQVTGIDDLVDDGNQNFHIVLSDAVSSDPVYDGLDIDDVLITNVDDDTASIIVSRTSLTTSENNGTDSFEVRLGSRPTDNVVLNIVSSNPGEARVSIDTIIFTPNDWDQSRLITVIGENDDQPDGDTLFSIEISSSQSNDPNFSTLAPVTISAENQAFTGPSISNPVDTIAGESSNQTSTNNDDNDEILVDPSTLIRKVDATGVDELPSTAKPFDISNNALELADFDSQFKANDFYRNVELNDLYVDAFLEAKEIAAEASASSRNNDDAELDSLWSSLDSLDDDIREQSNLPQLAAGSIASVATALTAGYLVWVIRSGQILIGLLSQLPAWTSMDMLAVLSKPEEDLEEETDSLESLVTENETSSKSRYTGDTISPPAQKQLSTSDSS